VAFQSEALPAGEGILGTVGRWAPAVLLRLLGVAFAAAMLLYVVRPLVLGLAARGRVRAEEALAGPGGAAALLTRQNLALTQQDPERAAQLVREWLREGAGGAQADERS
jgi:hypothetical protein